VRLLIDTNIFLELLLGQSKSVLAFVPVPMDEVTNCAFGDADLRTLFITAGGTLWSIRADTPGFVAWK
jgi:sugar lactone lactonase YvrE